MCTTTEFNGESAHIYDTYNITVFLTKQSLCSRLSCFLDWKVLLAQKEKNLQYEASQLQEKYQKGLITTADAQKQQQSIEKKIANYQSSAQKEAQTLDEENYVFSNRTQDLIMRAIKEINADKKYKLIVNATALLDADDALDITETVLAKVDELYAAEKNDTAKSDK